MTSLSDWAALIGSVGVAGLAIFEILLALGLPLGGAAFGGANAVLSAKLRVASGLSALLFVVALYVVPARGGLFGRVGMSWPVLTASWAFAALFALSALANVASRSRWERLLMAPVAVVLTICCVVLSLIS